MTRPTCERLAERAAPKGLLDVAYATADSPFGPLLLAATPRGLVRVSLPAYEPRRGAGGAWRLESPPASSRPRPGSTRRAASSTSTSRAGCDEFDLPLDWQLTAAASAGGCCERDARIPYGETRSYTEMAAAAGNERAFRAAGSALGSNPIPIVVPCHRVLRSGGALGGYGGGLPMKEALLKLEGATERDARG